MSVKSGKDGTLTHDGSEPAACVAWELRITSANDAYAANDTSGWKKRKGGVKDWTGSFTCKTIPNLDAGDEIALVLYDNDIVYTGNAIVDEEGVGCDMNEGTIVTYTIPFSANGAIAKTTGSYTE